MNKFDALQNSSEGDYVRPVAGAEDAPRVWDDKEIFLRGVFLEDPKKGCELLFKQYYKPMCSHAVRFVYSKEVAHDLVSDIFLVFFQKKLHERISTSYRAYLFIAVRNRCLKHLAKQFGKVDSQVTLADIDHETTMPSPQEIIQFQELSERIEKAVQALSPQRRKIFLLNRFEGKKYHEIATDLDVSVKTVEAHMSKALEALRQALQHS